MEERLAAPTLSRDEIIRHWLLNLAIECSISLRVLFPFRWPTCNAREIPNVQPVELARNLLELFDSGLIFVYSYADESATTRSNLSSVLERFVALSHDLETSSDPRSESRNQVRANPELQLSFKLTAPGGESWERVARPEWDRFITGYTTSPPYGETGPSEGELTSPDRDLLLAWMGWYPEVRREKILVETIKWESKADFEVLYWKRLPFVYRAIFKVETAEARWKSYEVPQWFDNWWTQSLHWHKEPWELPGWPS